jgi:hypothetical protein
MSYCCLDQQKCFSCTALHWELSLGGFWTDIFVSVLGMRFS